MINWNGHKLVLMGLTHWKVCIIHTCTNTLYSRKKKRYLNNDWPLSVNHHHHYLNFDTDVHFPLFKKNLEDADLRVFQVPFGKTSKCFSFCDSTKKASLVILLAGSPITTAGPLHFCQIDHQVFGHLRDNSPSFLFARFSWVIPIFLF